jgi:hypothetical protein
LITHDKHLGRCVMRICSSTEDWPACLKFHAADNAQYRVSVFYGLRDSIDNLQYNAPHATLMATEAVGMLTHAVARCGVTPSIAPRIPHA